MEDFFIPSNTTRNGVVKTSLDIPLKSLAINGYLPEKLIKYNIEEKLPEGFTNKLMLAGTAEYAIRSLGTTYKDEYSNLVGDGFAEAVPLNYITGFLGGALRGIVMEEKRYELDAFNAVLYEICNNYASCYKNPLISGLATIGFETFNFIAKTAARGELTLETLPIAAAKGATIGGLVLFLVYSTYLPAHITTNAAVDYMLPITEESPNTTIVGSTQAEPEL